MVFVTKLRGVLGMELGLVEKVKIGGKLFFWECGYLIEVDFVF
jgi:hypothetical protein